MCLKADLSSTSHILTAAEVLKRRHHGHLPSSRSGRDHGKSNVNGGPGAAAMALRGLAPFERCAERERAERLVADIYISW